MTDRIISTADYDHLHNLIASLERDRRDLRRERDEARAQTLATASDLTGFCDLCGTLRVRLGRHPTCAHCMRRERDEHKATAERLRALVELGPNLYPEDGEVYASGEVADAILARIRAEARADALKEAAVEIERQAAIPSTVRWTAEDYARVCRKLADVGEGGS